MSINHYALSNVLLINYCTINWFNKRVVQLTCVLTLSTLTCVLIDFFCCSPLGEVFRARLRQFPALVNCCTIDWFSNWPAEALQSVALRFLNDIPDLDCSDAVLNGLVCTLFSFYLNCVKTNSKPLFFFFFFFLFWFSSF